MSVNFAIGDYIIINTRTQNYCFRLRSITRAFALEFVTSYCWL